MKVKHETTGNDKHVSITKLYIWYITPFLSIRRSMPDKMCVINFLDSILQLS